MKAETLEDLLNIQHEWPQKGDRLLHDVDLRSRTVARLHTWPDHLGVFSAGYRRAADTVVQTVEDGNEIANLVCWPVLLLYRHAVELALKNCISWSSDALGEEEGIKKSEHRLRVLLDRLRVQSSQLFPGESDETLAAFADMVRDLDKIDPSGQTFRYPANVEGRPFELGIEHIDLSKLKLAMDKVLNFLEGYAGAASDCAEIRSEMLSEMHQE